MRLAAGWPLIRARSCRQSVQDRFPRAGPTARAAHISGACFIGNHSSPGGLDSHRDRRARGMATVSHPHPAPLTKSALAIHVGLPLDGHRARVILPLPELMKWSFDELEAEHHDLHSLPQKVVCIICDQIIAEGRLPVSHGLHERCQAEWRALAGGKP